MPKLASAAVRPGVVMVDGCLQVSGDLTFATVTALLQESTPLMAEVKGGVCIDLAAVSRADSAGLALLIEWMRLARAAGCELSLHAVPQQMLAIARASGLESILPLQPARG